MIFQSLSDIPYRKEQAIIINVGTRFVSTLALLSAINKTGIPVLLIDCEVEGKDDFFYFNRLMSRFSFDLISMPLKEHGTTLDFIFKESKSESILLIDSDLDLLDEHIVPLMLQNIENPKIFGCGFRHGGFYIKAGEDYEEVRNGYYEERMWIPFVLLKVSYIQEALENGFSFNIHTFYNIFPKHQVLSKKLLHSKKLLKWFPFFKKWDYHLFDFFKKEIHGEKPLIIFSDTGSCIYMYLRYQKFYYFAGVDSETGLESKYVNHYNGITRKLLYNDSYNTGNIIQEYKYIKDKLLNEYFFDIESFEKE